MKKLTLDVLSKPQEPSRCYVGGEWGDRPFGVFGWKRGASNSEAEAEGQTRTAIWNPSWNRSSSHFHEECDPFVGSCLETMEQAIQSKRGGSDLKHGIYAMNQLFGYLVGKGVDVHLTNDLSAQLENNPQSALAAVVEQTRGFYAECRVGFR